MGAIEQMRSLFVGSCEDQSPGSDRDTKTEGLEIGEPDEVQRIVQQTQCETRQITANGCEGETGVDAKKKSPKPLLVADLGGWVQENATGDVSSPGGTRNIALISGV